MRIAQATWGCMLAALTLAIPGTVQAAPPVSRCLAVAEAPPAIPRAMPAKFERAALSNTDVRLTYIGHSTFLIESAGGVRVVTDFNDYVRPNLIPEIVTMNRAHTSHYTDFPDSQIKHVLRGWNPNGGPARHAIELKDVHVRNVPTNIRDWGGGGTIGYGNSIFIFEIAGLCIGHLGHLHHTLTPEQLAAIGQLDVVLVPVDGGYTLDLAGMVEVVRALRARLIIPMHYFSPYTLARFLERMRAELPSETLETSEIVLNQRTLPAEPKILVLPGQ